jgi:cytochrome b561
MLRRDEDPGLRFFDRPIRIFHWVAVLLVAALSRQLGDVHEAVGLGFLGLILLPTAAALHHRFWRRDDTLRAMLPPRRRR